MEGRALDENAPLSFRRLGESMVHAAQYRAHICTYLPRQFREDHARPGKRTPRIRALSSDPKSRARLSLNSVIELRQKFRQKADVFKPKILLLFRFGRGNTFVNPCGLIWNVDGVGAQGDDGQNV